MDFSFDEQQTAIQDLALKVFGDHCDDERIRKVSEAGTVFDKTLWAQLGETGLIGVAASEAVGGSELGMLELSLVLEAQGKFLAPVPLWTSQITGLSIGAFGRSDVLKDFAHALHAGKASATIWTEASSAKPLSAVRTDKGWVLSGRVTSLIWGRAVDAALLPVEIDGALRYAVVSADRPEITWTEGELTHQQPAANIILNGVEISEDRLLSPEMTADWLETRTALCLASIQLGVIDEALRRAAVFLGEREQFGRPIGSFQGVAMRMADSYIEVEVLRGVQQQLAWRLDAGLDAVDAARVVRFQTCEAGHIVGHTAIHYHGGVGADLTYPIHRFYLWSRAIEMTGGGVEAHLAALGDHLPSTIGEEA